jgi:KaiC/GvpD/RAD55 family RecA-like ATPase
MNHNDVPEDALPDYNLVVEWLAEAAELQEIANQPAFLSVELAAAKMAAHRPRSRFLPELVSGQTQEIYPGEVIVYAGGPGTAKSSLVLALTKLWARQGVSCFTYCLEHPRLAVFHRLADSEMGDSFRVLQKSKGVAAAHAAQRAAVERLGQLPFVVKYDPIAGADGLYTQILQTQLFCRGMPADVVFVDNLRQLVADDSRQARQLMLGLKEVARELDVTIVATFPLPLTNDRPPELADFKKWEPVAMLADRVFGLHRSEIEEESDFIFHPSSRSSKMLIDIYPLRNSLGSRDVIDLLFDGRLMSFSHDVSTTVRTDAVLYP